MKYLIALLFIVSCGQGTQAPEPTPVPTETPTPIPVLECLNNEYEVLVTITILKKMPDNKRSWFFSEERISGFVIEDVKVGAMYRMCKLHDTLEFRVLEILGPIEN